jgi:fructose-1,6-bisphosphatase/inositol monophosphatase family enzyme
MKAVRTLPVSSSFADGLDAPVQALLREVAADVVLPRFCNLVGHEISEKSPGEVVTIVDLESELRLRDGLARLGVADRIVGEEAATADHAILDNLDRGRAWIIDPIDGTANFAAGRSPFGMILALVEDGITEAGWLFDPVTGRMCHAVRGGGAFIDGEAFFCRQDEVRSRPLAALASQFMPEGVREGVHRCAETAFDIVPIPRCAAEHYPRVALGQNDVALFQRTLPWDHAAGTLFLSEAGGWASRWDGSAYRIGDGKPGLIVARTPALGRRALSVFNCAALDLPVM